MFTGEINTLSKPIFLFHFDKLFSGSGKTYLHPVVLSQYDIVMTTYEVLRREIHFTNLTEEKRYF